jgi:DNA-binding MarR family transcriptional regulator
MKQRPDLRISQTYLHKVRLLANALDKTFDQVLRTHANLTLSQFMLLAAVTEHGTINQRKIAHFIGISPPAIKRQVDLALGASWLEVVSTSKPLGQVLRLTPKGQSTVAAGLQVLEKQVFKIFSDSNRQTDLMTHINLLLGHMEGVANEQVALKQGVNNRKGYYERSNSQG